MHIAFKQHRKRGGKLLFLSVLAIVMSLTPLLPAAFQKKAEAATCDTACKLFNDSASLQQQNPKPFGWGIGGHAETSTIIWNGNYYMYYRTFISASGQICGYPQGIALATSSDSGNTWVQYNGGKPLGMLSSVQQNGNTCIDDKNATSTWVYSPDVIADDKGGMHLTMAFERRDWVPYGNNTGRALNTVWYATSTDGINWSGSTRLLKYGTVGDYFDEVGTPDLERDGAGYVLTFHYHDSGGHLTQGRATVRMNNLVEDYTGPKTKYVLNSTPSWANYGIGMGDMRREADGYWYMVFEAFGGASGQCGRADTTTTVGIARSTDAVNWTVRGAPLIKGLGISCGWDMPSWQIMGNARGIVTPDDSAVGDGPSGKELVRWNIIDKVPASPSGGQILQNQYLQAPNCINNGVSRTCMQGDGNMVQYRNSDNAVLWASDTDHSGAVRAYMQYDGNLVLQRADGSPVKATATDGRPGAYFDTFGDHVQITEYGNVVWLKTAGQRGM